MPLTLEEEPIELKEAAARSADGGNFADDTFVQDLLREADHPKLSSEELQTLMFNMTFDQAKQVSQATTNDNITKLLAVAARLKRNTSATLAFRDVCLELDGVLKLRGASGVVRPGEMVCVMGAPDSGVTPLFQVLSGQAIGRRGALTGQILLDGALPGSDRYRRIGFIDKNDVHIPSMTVAQTLRFSLNTHAVDTLPEALAAYRVGIVMKLLGLAHVADNIIGNQEIRGISGGEKRRVSIGVALVVGHDVILADLPTNGLDSTTALEYIKLNRKISDSLGKGFMTSLVQPAPEILACFDSLLLMSKGATMYFGPVHHVDAYFHNLGFHRGQTSLPDFLELMSCQPESFYEGERKVPKLLTADVSAGAGAALAKADPQVDEKDRGSGSSSSSGSGSGSGSGGGSGTDTRFDRKEYAAYLNDMETLSPPPASRSALWEAVMQHFPLSPFSAVISEYTSIRPVFGDRLVAKQKAHLVTDKYKGRAVRRYGFKAEYAQSGGNQLYYVMHRAFWTMLNAPSTLIAGIVVFLIIPLLLGSLFTDLGNGQNDVSTRFGLIFIMTSFISMSNSVDIKDYMEERGVFYAQREARYYHPALYTISFFTVRLPYLALRVFLMLSIAYPWCGLDEGWGSGKFFFAYCTLLLLHLTFRSWVFFLCMLAPNKAVAGALPPVTMVLFMLFAGFMIPQESIPVFWQWLYFLSPFRPAFRALAMNEFYGQQFTCTDSEFIPPSYHPLLNVPTPNGFGGNQVCPVTTFHEALAKFDIIIDDEGNDMYNELLVILLFYIAFSFFCLLTVVFTDNPAADSSLNPTWDDKPLAEEATSDSTIDIDIACADDQERKAMDGAYLSFTNLSYSVEVPADPSEEGGRNAGTKELMLLNGIVGYAKPGMMVALMGPSGAGKSTLLDVLANKKTGGTMKGEILVNGKPRDETFSRLTGYVEQTDSHDIFCTVRQAVEFSAMLRLPDSLSADTKRAKAHSIIQRLGLQEVVDDLIGDVDTGGVSPEMRKKVTIAVELVMNPGILFLDEPTTGLDAPSAIAVMNAVESLSRKISVLCTIHQPSAPVFAKFNYMLLLQKRGTVAFFGPTTDIQSYFERVNPSFTNSANRNLAEYALDAIAKIPGDITQAFELFKTDSAGHYSNTLELLSDSDSHSSSSEKKGLLARNSEDGKYDGGKDEGKDEGEGEGTAFIPRGTVFQQYASSFASSDWLQFTVLLTRFRVSYLQNAAGLRARLMPCIIIAIVYGTLFVQLGDNQSGATNRISLNFLVLLFAGFTANFAMSSHVSARALIFRETTSNSYKKYVYFLARTVADLPYILLEMVTFSTAIYWIAGLRNEDGDGEEFFIFVAAVFLFRMICMSVAELAASVFGDQTVAALVASLVSMMNMFFAGFLILYAEIPAYWSWMFWLSYQHYALFVMSAIELRNMVFQCPGNEGTLLVEVWDKADAGENVSCASYDPLANLAALDPNCYKSICPIQSGNTILDAYSIDYTDADIFNYLAVLAGIYAFVKVVAFVAFVNVEHIRR